MLSFEKDLGGDRYLWLGGNDTVTPEDIKTLVECYKEAGYIVRCNHKKDHHDPIQAKFLGNHIWYMTKDDDHWLMLAFHYGRSQWFVESFEADDDGNAMRPVGLLNVEANGDPKKSYLVE